MRADFVAEDVVVLGHDCGSGEVQWVVVVVLVEVLFDAVGVLVVGA